MQCFNIEFTPNKCDKFNIFIWAKNLTEAYIEFVKRFPIDYIITDITGVKV